MLDGIVGRTFIIGYPSEYVLNIHLIGKNVLKCAAKHLLGMINKDDKKCFANFFSRFTDVCSNAMLIEPHPNRGTEDIH